MGKVVPHESIKPTRTEGVAESPEPQQQELSLSIQDLQQSIHHQITFHQQHTVNNSYLRQLIDCTDRTDEESLQTLEALSSQLNELQIAGNNAPGAAIKRDVRDSIIEDNKSLSFQDELNHYGSALLKA